MKKSKTILLALIFAFSFSFAIFYFINSILNTIKPAWYQGDYAYGDIFWWVFFGLFFLASLSSILWLTNKVGKFWFLKIPALLILPFSIPFLIIDYLDFKKIKDKQEQKIKKWIVLLVVCLLNYFTIAA